jgi:glycosyltransferase involved in cell wall biosynthesis
VVACASGGAPEAVIDGQTGLLVPPGDADALVAALDRLLSSPDLRQRLGANGRRSVEQYFAADRMVDRVEAIYGRLIEAPAPPAGDSDDSIIDATPAGAP